MSSSNMIGLFAGALITMGAVIGISDATASESYRTRQAWVHYSSSDNLNIPALLIAPTKKGRYPAMLYIHGRWGLNDKIIQQLQTIAQRGVVIMAPDYYFARAIPVLPAFNDSDVSSDLDSAIPFFSVVLKEATTLNNGKIAILADDHGGYHALQIGARHPNKIGAIIGYNPLVQDPNAAKPKQLYQYMQEIDQIRSPTMFLVGGNERQMRRIGVSRAVDRLRELKQTVVHIEYPGAQRCFEWRVDSNHLPDSLARLDSINQIVRFVGTDVGGENLLVLEPDGWKFL